MIVSGTFRATVAASEAQDFISNSDVQNSFVAAIAKTVNVPESTVEVTLSVFSSGGSRRLTAEAEILVTYTITVEVGTSGDAGVMSESELDSIADTLASTTAGDLVADFNTEFQSTDSGTNSVFSAVAAVEGSETTPTIGSAEPPTINSRAEAAFPQALLLATVCWLIL